MMENTSLKNPDSIKLIEDPNHLEFVKKIAWRYYKRVPYEKRGLLTIEDLISAGYEGLTKAAGKYKHDNGVKFTTYSANEIKGEIKREMRFYLGKDALLLDDSEIMKFSSYGHSVEEEAISHDDPITIPEEEQVKIISSKLREFDLTEDEITVYMAVNGIGCSKVTNFRILAKQMKKRVMDIMRIKQIAESKLKKSLN